MYMINNEDLHCALRILELRTKVFDLNLKQFNPKDYPEYEHTMTHQEESGIDDYSKFTTYEFRI